MTTSHICIMIAIIVYLGAMIYVGYLCSKKNNDTSDFYLGGRKLGPLVTAMSAEASDMSSWLLMGLPGLAYLSGIADAGWTAIGLAIGTYLNWKIVAKRIRLYTHVAGNSITLPSFFSNRFRDNRHLLQSIGAIFIVIFFIPYTASGFAACGILFSGLKIPNLTVPVRKHELLPQRRMSEHEVRPAGRNRHMKALGSRFAPGLDHQIFHILPV